MKTPKAQKRKDDWTEFNSYCMNCGMVYRKKCACDLIKKAKSQTELETLKRVYEKAYKLDWSEDRFVIWLEAEIKKLERKKDIKNPFKEQGK